MSKRKNYYAVSLRIYQHNGIEWEKKIVHIFNTRKERDAWVEKYSSISAKGIRVVAMPISAREAYRIPSCCLHDDDGITYKER